MAYLSLFRKYRPSTFEEVVGQEHITRTLKNSLDAKRIAHAYLFCGPRGTGKTTSARIFAKALNCEKGETSSPCNKCEMCRSINNGSALDVIELDAASNTQVDKVREFIIQRVNFSPTKGKYKVYIIDEVHKLSDASFNALLKTLEEPPLHTVFILATTHPHELLPTILSRCQRFDFKRISREEIVNYLRKVALNEKGEIEEGALNLIARHSEGSLRDCLVILEQLFSYAALNVKARDVNELLGLTDEEALFDLSSVLVGGDTVKALEMINEFIEKGADIEKLCQDFIEFYRRVFVVKISYAKLFNEFGDDYVKKLQEHSGRYSVNKIMNILRILIDLKTRLKDTSISRVLWEMAVVKITKWETEPSLDQISEKVLALEEIISARRPLDAVQSAAAPPAPQGAAPKIIDTQAIAATVSEPAKEKAPQDMKTDVLAESDWQKILQAVKKEKVSLHAILVEAKPSLEGESVVLQFKKGYDFHKDKVLENKNYLKSLFEKHLLKKLELKARVADLQEPDKDEEKHDELVKNVMDVFG